MTKENEIIGANGEARVANRIDSLFPEGRLFIRVRNGEKTAEGKHKVARIESIPGEWSDAFLAIVMEAGARALIAEKLNNVPGEGGKKAKAAAEMFAAADRGELPPECVGRAPKSGAGGMDPVDAAIYKDGLAWIGALLADKAAKAGVVGTGAGGRFVAADWAAVGKGGALESVFDAKGNADSSKVVEFVKAHNPAMVEAARARVEAAKKPKGLTI